MFKPTTLLFCTTLLFGCTTQSRLDAPPPMTVTAPATTASEYQSLRLNPGTHRWWNSATVYEIWPRSFKDSDGDGNGDFNGMTSKLDYLKDFGVDAIWLTPMFEAPSYHGYDFQDFYSVERDYGTMADFEHFVAQSHARGIKVILDLVLNHISDQHDWFLKSARREPGYEDHFIWREQRPEGWGPAWSDQPNPEAVWHWNATRKAYYYGAFGGSQPDVNLKHPKVVEELDRLAAFWLQKGIDGFRLDAVRYAVEDGPMQQADTQTTIDYWTGFARRVKAVNPDALLVGEAWAALEISGRYRSGGAGLDAGFDFDFGNIVIDILNPNATRRADFGTLSNTDTSKKRDSLWANLQQRAAAAPMDYFSPFLTNHDQNRIMHTLKGDNAKARIAASLLLTSPGTAYLYYGEEIGLSQHGIGEDRYRRAPMQWNDDANAGFNTTGRSWTDLPAPQGYRGDQGAWWSTYWKQQRDQGHSVAAQQADPASLYSHYKRLLAVRRQNPNLQQPQELRYYPVTDTNAWVLQALGNGRDTWVIINLDPANAVTFDVPAALRGERVEQLSGAKTTLSERATLKGGQSWIF